jgi:hypothetical protein
VDLTNSFFNEETLTHFVRYCVLVKKKGKIVNDVT